MSAGGPTGRGTRVKCPILSTFTLVLMPALGALLVTAYGYEAHVRQHDLANSVRAVDCRFRLQIDNDAAKLHATLCPISRGLHAGQGLLTPVRAILAGRQVGLLGILCGY